MQQDPLKALIIVVIFASLARGNLVMFQELGLGVAVALLLDATIVRIVLVPAAMSLLGRWNWWPSELSREPVDDLPAAPTQRLEPGVPPPRLARRRSTTW